MPINELIPHPHCSSPVWPGGSPSAIAAARVASRIRTGDATGCAVGLIGLADDLGVRLNHGRPGAAGGPTAFRAALARYGVAEPYGFTYPLVFDAGDIVPAPGDTEEALHETHRRVSAATRALLERGMFPVAMGGGHDLTFAFVRGVIEHYRELGDSSAWAGVYLDAHLDVRETVGSGMPFRRLVEHCGVSRLDIVGMNPLVNTREHVEWFYSHGGRVAMFPGDSLLREETGWRFASVDLDGIDSSQAPGVSAPNVHGLSSDEAVRWVRALGGSKGVKCFDIMELCPVCDLDGRTARLAAHLFLEFLAAFGARREIATEVQGIGIEDSKRRGRRTLLSNARILTLSGAGPTPKRGATMNDLGVIARGDVLIEDGKIAAVTKSPWSDSALSASPTTVIDAAGRVVCPGFVDCHTHLCYAGSRVDEWSRRLAGESYLDILKSGGGIMATVRSVREATREALEEALEGRVKQLLASGTTTVEVKSGYGLDLATEIKMLEAIDAVRKRSPGRVFATALLGHAIDPAIPDFAKYVIGVVLPAVSHRWPGIAIDAFCEQGAWPLEDCLRLFDAARAAGHPCRVHADQFNDLGMACEAAARGFISIDHLEGSSLESLKCIAESQTIGVGLPLCGLHMADGRFANLRAFVDFGGACAIATNCNPGSAPSASMPLAIAAAVRYCKLTPAEAIAAATVNAAAVLGLADRGRIEAGLRADLLVLKYDDERRLAYEMGGEHIDHVMVGGELV